MLFLRLLPLLAAVVWLARGDEGGAAVLMALGVAALGVTLLRPPPVLDRAFLAAVGVASVGQVAGLYGEISWFDSVVHAGVGAVAAPVLTLALVRRGVVTAQADGLVTVLVVSVVGAALGAGWELFEAGVDVLTGSHLQESLADTNRDLLADTLGAAAGALLLVQAGARPRWAMRSSVPR